MIITRLHLTSTIRTVVCEARFCITPIENCFTILECVRAIIGTPLFFVVIYDFVPVMMS